MVKIYPDRCGVVADEPCAVVPNQSFTRGTASGYSDIVNVDGNELLRQVCEHKRLIGL